MRKEHFKSLGKDWVVKNGFETVDHPLWKKLNQIVYWVLILLSEKRIHFTILNQKDIYGSYVQLPEL